MRSRIAYTREQLIALRNAETGNPQFRNAYNPTIFRPGAFACVPTKPLDSRDNKSEPDDCAPMICIS
ncbi:MULTISPECIES: hypothetical protein [Legionella]|uniref:Uncharacterized protein n=1 Tax=Legionella maceachernii TaxID=466 RepID=A0A0W0VYX4_9GAMM|nr:hypothetical protein [Legionella maceachernii]KTD25193.1 hypothetical protein Lmac_2171 [Legionella maceachernii]SJZ76074.1 hypothetical protein SAMN02745128_00963 [Legionella maceachernii]SUP03145.1 Uncharacterised protein [Legionella maceachernii]